MNDMDSSSRQNRTENNDSLDPGTLSTEKAASSSQDFDKAFQQGTKLLHHGLAAESIPYLEQAFALQPDNADAVINLSGAYIMTKKFNKAVVILEPTSGQIPNHAKLWINLGAAYLGNPILARDAEQEKAIFAFERALEIDPIAPSVAYNIGLIYRDRRDSDRAIHWFRQAVKHNPNDKDARSLLRRLESE